MDSKTFDDVIEHVDNISRDTLMKKNGAYNPSEDKLAGFKTAANLQGITPREACVGMMAKHIVSVFDMVGAEGPFDEEVWDEKIGDSINYMYLLRALIVEETMDRLEREDKMIEDAQTMSSERVNAEARKNTMEYYIDRPNEPIPEGYSTEVREEIQQKRKEAEIERFQKDPYKPTAAEQTLIGKLVNNPDASIPEDKPQGFKDAVEFGRRLAKGAHAQ
jgi:hypothetical protein